MKQVFFITDDRMTAMLWQGSQLISKHEFDDSKMPKLAEYLESSKDIVASIIVDVLEEEISLTTIPHVSAHERKFLIDRTLTRLHRGVEFSTANIIGREKNKRRDDRLLVSGMTSSNVLMKWLDVFNQHDLLIKGIYSLPLIAGSILDVLKIKKGLTLLVSRQSKNFIRQSIFKDGQLFYSRNIPSSQNLEIEAFSVDLQKTRKYLENQKFLSTDDRVDVLILASDRFYKQLAGLDELLPDMDISYVQHNSVQKMLGIKSDSTISGREIFSSLLLGSFTKNHYGRGGDLVRYKNKIRDRVVNYSSVLVALVLIPMTSVFYIDIEVLDHKVKGVQEQLSVLKAHNDRLENDLEKLPAKAKQMKLFVNNVSDVKAANQKNIKESLIAISKIFHAYENIFLVSLSWNLNETEYKLTNKNLSRSQRGRVVTNSTKDGHVVEIEAKVDLSNLSNQNALRVVDNFVASLKKLEAVSSVTIIKQAIKASSKDSMRGTLSNIKDKQAELSLILRMEGGGNASK